MLPKKSAASQERTVHILKKRGVVLWIDLSILLKPPVILA